MLREIKLWLRDESPSSIQDRYRRLREVKDYTLHGRFHAVKEICGGLLSPAVYQKIHKTLLEVGNMDCVEIGGAAGAGSIVAGWALKEGGGTGHLIVVEKCEGGSRASFGGRDENLERIQSNFRTFELHDRIRLFPHELTEDNGDEVFKLIETGQIGALILDADGRLDRDFSIFWEHLADSAPIIVDDYKNEREFCPRNTQMPDGGIKKVLTYRLLNAFTEWGLFEWDEKLGTTVFGHKPEGASFDHYDPQIAAQIVDDLRAEWRVYLRENDLPEQVDS